MPTPEETNILIFIPVGLGILWVLREMDNPPASTPATRDLTKEAEFLRYNNDEIFMNMLQAEGHLEKIIGKPVVVSQGHAACVVKHWADSEGNSREAVNHSADLNGQPTKYKEIAENLNAVRHDFQDDKLTPEEALVKARGIRREFESFNPSFNITKCKACTLEK